MSNVKRWASYTAEAAEAEKEILDKVGGGDFMKLKVGINVLRILPPLEGETSAFAITFQHFIKLPGMKESVSFNCPRRMNNTPCPACSKADALKATGNQSDYEAAKEFFPNYRVFCRVIDRNDENAGPKILPITKTVHEALVAIRNDVRAGGDFTHPEDGFDIIIEREGTSRDDTKYSVRAARDESPIGTEEQVDEWFEMMPDLKSRALVQGSREIRKMLLGAGLDEEDLALPAHGEASEERPARRRRSVEDSAMGK